MGKLRWEHGVLALGVLLIALGHGLGLFWAPPEAMMGEVGRILYVHVPTAWVALVTYLVGFTAAVGSLWTARRGWDAAVESAVEVGILLNGLLLFQGSVWARPTWGVFWTWDPRLTTTAVMVFSFAGVAVLRKLVHRPERRAVVSAVSTIIAFVNVPIVYFSVKWWKTLHQPFSNPSTVDSAMVLPLRVAAFGMLFFSIGVMAMRWRIAMRRLEVEDSAPDMPAAKPALELK